MMESDKENEPRQHTTPWLVGEQNARESKRFTYPLVSDRKDWPFVALFEQRRDALMAAQRVNDYPGLVADVEQLRREKVELETRLAELQARLLVGEADTAGVSR